VLNQPIYVGASYPLLPDFIDLKPLCTSQQIISAQPQTLNDQISTIMNLTNIKRTQWNRTNISLESRLSVVAQNHSNDMVMFNYLSHYSIATG
jgi:uncharacterized protein YkwD